MNPMVTLATQPLFRLIAAIIVLLVTDYNLGVGILAALLWIVWILMPSYFLQGDKNRRLV